MTQNGDDVTPQDDANLMRMFCLPVTHEQGVDFSGYAALHNEDVKIAERTLAIHRVGIGAWQDVISLAIDFTQGTHVFEGSEVVSKSKNLRMAMVIGAMLTAKTALETCLSGRYVQAFMMCRFLIESWIRIAYLDLDPHAIKQWLGHDGLPAQHPKNTTLLKHLRKHPTHGPSAQHAESLLNGTDKYAHPSRETFAAIMHQPFADGVVGTRYIHDMAVDCIDLAATSCLIIAAEIEQVRTVDASFETRYRTIDAALETWRRSDVARHTDR